MSLSSETEATSGGLNFQPDTRFMSVHIRLARHGSKKSPFYRVVVTDVRSPRDGRFIENLGTVNPTVEPPQVALDHARLEYWKGQGAKPSATLDKILKQNAAAAAGNTAS